VSEFVLQVNGVNDITVKLDNLSSSITKTSILNLIATKIKNNIFVRTSAGYDQNYRKFLPYSPGYAKYKGTTRVNLSDTGQMLNEMTQKVISNDTVKLFFMEGRARDLAFKHMNTAKKIRSFFGVNARDEAEATLLYEKELTAEIARIGL
jgi:hypothetical protein